MMHARIHVILCAALAAGGCGLIDGLGSLQFDLPPDGGGGAGAGGGGGAGAGGGGGAPDAGARDGAARDAAPDAVPDAAPDAAPCAPAGYVCAAAAPSGWEGPVAFYEGATGTVPSSCPVAYPVVAAQGQAGLGAQPATCGACSCTTPTVTCGPEPLSLYSGSGCWGSPDETLTPAQATCTPLQGAQTMADHFQQTAPPPSVSTCTPSGGAPDLPPPVWTTSGVVCGIDGQPTTCADGSVCAPAPVAPFEARWCIWQAGAQSCPAGFPKQHTWEQVDDGRGCAPCTCGSAVGAKCAATTAFYGDPQCQSPLSQTAALGTCVHQDSVEAVVATTSPSGTPSCPTGGGGPTGSAVAVPVTTICCPP